MKVVRASLSLLLAVLPVWPVLGDPSSLDIFRNLQTAAECSFQEDFVSCETAIRTCNSLAIEGCTASCVDSQACGSSNIEDSIISCQGDRSCESATMRRSDVNCNETPGGFGSCRFTEFLASAVDCPSTEACGSAGFHRCSCCDQSGGCPTGVSSCQDINFCGELHVGRTCKEWGNPFCANVAVDPSPEPRNPAATCTLAEDVVECELAGRPCNSLPSIRRCSLECHDACKSSIIEDSWVVCVLDRACESSTMRRSEVTCDAFPGGFGTCRFASMFASAVECPSTESCGSTDFHRCSCCSEAAGCPAGVPLCTPNTDLMGFCGETHLGRTCKDWGNPVCSNVTVEAAPSPRYPAATCSLNEDVVICEDGVQTCNSLFISECTVECHDACRETTLEDSWVQCVTDRSCESSTMRRSEVTCNAFQGGFGTCRFASMFASAVTCESSESCSSAAFDECSCCDGAGCPVDVLNCRVDRDALCATVSNGSTCAALGNPVCATLGTTASPTGAPSLNPMPVDTNTPTDTPAEGLPPPTSASNHLALGASFTGMTALVVVAYSSI